MTAKGPYRFSIRAYPPGHRRRHGDELIATAIEMHGGRWSVRQSASFLVNGLLASLRQPRRWWGLAVLFPVLYATGQLADLVAHHQAELPGWHDQLDTWLWIGKWLTIPSLPVLLVLSAEKVTERHQRWRTATLLWLVLGIGLVLVVRTRIESISGAVSTSSFWRLWPTGGTDRSQQALEALGGFGSGWTPGQILARELIAVVVLAVISGFVLRHCSVIGLPVLSAGAVPLATIGVLFVYSRLAPWSFRSDFDFFVGDLVLGSTLGELLFFPAPFDPIGSLAIGIAALSMGGLIVAWGGVAEAARRRPAVAVPDPAVAVPSGPSRPPLPLARSES